MARTKGATKKPKKDKKNDSKSNKQQNNKTKKVYKSDKPALSLDLKNEKSPTFNTENTIICGTRTLTAHLLENFTSSDSSNRNVDIIFENDYALDIFKSKLVYQQNQTKLNLSNKKDFIKRRHKNDLVVLFCINEPLNFMQRVEEGERRKELHKLNKHAQTTKKNKGDEETKANDEMKKESRKYVIYVRKVTTEMLNSGFRIRHITKSIDLNKFVRLTKILMKPKTSFYELLDQSIAKNKQKDQPLSEKEQFLSENSQKEQSLSENKKIGTDSEILDKRTPIYIINPSPNSYFPMLLSILDALKKYNSRILIITTNPNKLVDILQENSIECAQYNTTSYTEDYKKLDTKTSRIIVSNIRYTFERFDFVIEFCLKDVSLLDESIIKKLNKSHFELGNLEKGRNQKQLDILEPETKSVGRFDEIIFEKGIIILPIYTQWNNKESQVVIDKKYSGEFDIKRFYK